jgi:quercetin dioxygenase-like cupin family protein
MVEATIRRKQLLEAALGSRTLTSVDAREITLEAGQIGGRHLHPCPVVGYILSGVAIYQKEGEQEQLLPAGTAFYEPADVVVAQFGNASSKDELRFLAFYLLEGKQDLITMLEPQQGAQ